MRNLIIETCSSFNMSNLQGFDTKATGKQVFDACGPITPNCIWQVNTSLSRSQVRLLKSILRVGLQFKSPKIEEKL